MASRTAALDLRWKSGGDVPAFCELLYAALDDLDPIAIHDADDDGRWRVFFRTHAARDAAAVALRDRFAERLTAIDAVDVPDEDWARRSQAGLRAVRVGRLTIAPPWDAASCADPGTLIIIDPSTGFGTGHHETTRLCLSLLQEIDLAGRSALDVGTGSGVLAIAAARLGARIVTAIDDDPDALRNAAENATLNGARDAVSLVHADIGTFRSTAADVVTANLTGAVLVRYARALAALTAPGGTIIASGFATAEADEVADSLGGSIERQANEGDWAAMRLRRPGTRS
jgi:ribosomal protein L11 methyltransferase